MIDRIEILGDFWPRRCLSKQLRQLTDTRKWNYNCTAAQLAILRLFFCCPSTPLLTRSLAASCCTFSLTEIVVHGRKMKMPKFVVVQEIRSWRPCHSFRFYWSLSQSLWNFFELSIVANTRYAAGISMLSVIISVLKMHQTRFPPGHRPGPDPILRELMTLPRPSSRLRRGTVTRHPSIHHPTKRLYRTYKIVKVCCATVQYVMKVETMVSFCRRQCNS